MRLLFFLFVIISSSAQNKYAVPSASVTFDDEFMSFNNIYPIRDAGFSKAFDGKRDVIELASVADEKNVYNISGVSIYLKLPENMIDLEKDNIVNAFWLFELGDYEFKPFNGNQMDFIDIAKPFTYFVKVYFDEEGAKGSLSYVLNNAETNYLNLTVENKEISKSKNSIVFSGFLQVDMNIWSSSKHGYKAYGSNSNSRPYSFNMVFLNVPCSLCRKKKSN